MGVYVLYDQFARVTLALDEFVAKPEPRVIAAKRSLGSLVRKPNAPVRKIEKNAPPTEQLHPDALNPGTRLVTAAISASRPASG